MRNRGFVLRNALEEDALVAKEKERSAENRVDPPCHHTRGDGCGAGRIHTPKLHPIRIGKGKRHIMTAGGPGDELDPRIGRYAMDFPHSAGQRIEQFNLFEIILPRFAEIPGIDPYTADTGFAGGQLRDRYATAVPVCQHCARIILGKIDGRHRTGHRDLLNFRSGMTETVSQHQRPRQKQDGGQKEDSFHNRVFDSDNCL